MKVPSRYLTLQLTGTGFDNIYVANGDGYKAIGDGENQISQTEANPGDHAAGTVLQLLCFN